MNADEIKGWLEPSGAVKAAPGPANGQSSGSRRPQRVEASRHVVTRSPEMHIHDTDKLILIFKDAPPGTPPPSGNGASNNPAPPTSPSPLPPATNKLGAPQ